MEEFIKTLTEQIRCVKARDGVARELSDHILDQARAYEESGTSHDEAVEMAVREMGDAVEIGVSLDRIHRPQMNWKMIWITFILNIVGLFVIYGQYGASDIVSRQYVFTAAGFGIILTVNFIDYSILGRFGHMAYILVTAALFIGSLSLPRMNGRVPAMSMLVYLYVPLFAGVLYRLRTGGYGAVIAGAVLVCVTAALSVTFSNSILIGANIFLILIILMLVAVRKNMFHVNKKITAAAIAFLPVAASAVYVHFTGAAFRTQRIKAFLHPNQYSTGSGYIYTIIREILGNLRLIGKGGAVEIYVNDYDIPDAVNSLVPLQIMYFYGICAGLLLLLLFAVFIIIAMKIVRSQKNQLGLLVSVSCFLVLFVNCFEGILMNLGLCPVTTVSIPFITRGGSVVFVYSVLTGLLLSVHRYENVIVSEKNVRRQRWRLSVKLERE